MTAQPQGAQDPSDQPVITDLDELLRQHGASPYREFFACRLLVRREYIEQTALLQKVENLATYMNDSKAPSVRQFDVDTEALVRAEEPIDAFLAREGMQGCIAGPPA